MQAKAFEVAVVRAGLDLDGAIVSGVAILTLTLLGFNVALALFTALRNAAPCWSSAPWSSPAGFTITGSLHTLAMARASWIWALQLDGAFWTSPANVALTRARDVTTAMATATALL